MSLPLLTNDRARRLFLHHHLLDRAPSGAGKGAALAALIAELGFVQLDSVNTLARAHDLILWSRRQQYRPENLNRLLARDRAVFEHWTHDAAVLPIGHFAHWRKRFTMDEARLSSRWAKDRRAGFMEQIDAVLRQISDHGPCGSRDVGAGEAKGSGGWWDWHPSKTALEYLWRSGQLAVTRREGFRKVYDLTERVIPPEHLNARHHPDETIDWACSTALDRLGFGTSGELAAFWELVTRDEARNWAKQALADGRVIEVMIEDADGKHRKSLAWPDTPDRAASLPQPPNRLRLLSPFDPALRDRTRAERLFGFHYRIEIFVPAAQRRYGYYVFPVMEGARMIGRVDASADRKSDTVTLTRFWPEAGIRMGKERQRRITAELTRVLPITGCTKLQTAPDWTA